MAFIGCGRFKGAYLFIRKVGAVILTPWLIVPRVVEVDVPAVKVNEGGEKVDERWQKNQQLYLVELV